MNTNRVRGIRLAGLVIAVVALVANTRVDAQPFHFVFHIDETYVDTESFCVPVMAHMTGTIAFKGSGDDIAIVQPIKTQWTNLDTGKKVTTLVDGRGFQSLADGSFTFTGGHVFQGTGRKLDIFGRLFLVYRGV
jgi:hypothetical protein